jgi:transposase
MAATASASDWFRMETPARLVDVAAGITSAHQLHWLAIDAEGSLWQTSNGETWASPRIVEASPLRRPAMTEARRRFDQDFKEGAVRLVRETGRPVARIAKDLGINSGTLGNWVAKDELAHGGDGRLGKDERAELARLRRENAELAMERDVLKRSVALWVKDAMGR